MINGKQNVKLKRGPISFRNYLKQFHVPFKIYADLSVILLKLTVHKQKNINHIFLVVLLTKLFVLIINSVKKLLFTEEKMLFTNLFKQFLGNIVIVMGWRDSDKQHFDKNLIMSTEEEERFQLANSCWICDKLFDVGDDKVGDHCHKVYHIRVVILILK